MGRGGFKYTHADLLMTSVIKASLKETGINAADIGDITVGSTTVDLTQVLSPASLSGSPCLSVFLSHCLADHLCSAAHHPGEGRAV